MKTRKVIVALMGGFSFILWTTLVAADDRAESPQSLLESKGLKKVGGVYVLEGESAVLARMKTDDSKFAELTNTYNSIVAINANEWMLQRAEALRDGTAFDNADLNTALDSGVMRGGPRVNSLNSEQRKMHDQLLENRTTVNNLNRMIADLKRERQSLGNRQKLIKDFEQQHTICLGIIRGIDDDMTAVSEKYAELKADLAVSDALVKLSTTGKVKLGPSAKFNEAREQLRVTKLQWTPAAQLRAKGAPKSEKAAAATPAPAASKPSSTSDPAVRAAESLRAAKSLDDRGEIRAALVRYRQINSKYPGTPQAEQAAERIKALEAK